MLRLKHLGLANAMRDLGYMNGFYIFEWFTEQEVDVLLWCERLDEGSRRVHYLNQYMLFEGKDWTQQMVEEEIDRKIKEIKDQARRRLVAKLPKFDY